MRRAYGQLVVPRLDESDAAIAAYWTFAAAADTPPYEARPDAQTDILFAIRDGQPSLLVVGTHEQIRRKSTAQLETLCARIAPGAVSQLFAVPASVLRGAAVPLAELWPHTAPRLLDQLAAAPRTARLGLLRAAIAAHRRPSPTSPLTREAIRRLAHTSRIASLAADLGVGERRLCRAFARDVGLDPRAVRSLARLHHALALLPVHDCTTTAFAAGYFDQPHLNAHFRRWLACTPAQLRARTPVLTAPAALANSLLQISH